MSKWQGYPAVPSNKRCMLLVGYDLFPHMLVHEAHVLPDKSYRWVSSWRRGHQNLGHYPADSKSLLSIMSVGMGKRLKKGLDALRRDHWVAERALHGGFVENRDQLLKDLGIVVFGPLR
jgi:hypothetical protein